MPYMSEFYKGEVGKYIYETLIALGPSFALSYIALADRLCLGHSYG